MSLPMYMPGLANVNFKAFEPNSAANNRHYAIWHKPRHATMLFVRAIGAGGNGGNGAIGANSTAAGGGGGGSGSQATLLVPLALLPDVLYVTVGMPGSAINTVVSVAPGSASAVAPANYILLVANAGGNGGNASGATAGSAGTAGALPSVSQFNLAGLGIFNFLAGQAGIIGGVAVAGANLTIPTTGLLVTGGTGGGGLPAAAINGTVGGNITGVVATGTLNELKTISGGVAPTAATTPPGNGSPGYATQSGWYLGGAGGASTHGSATGAGLVQSSGGNGALGGGGGGSGGALTGATAGVAGRGGEGGCWFVWW